MNWVRRKEGTRESQRKKNRERKAGGERETNLRLGNHVSDHVVPDLVRSVDELAMSSTEEERDEEETFSERREQSREGKKGEQRLTRS